ncbi:protein-export membrane protein, SecD/SecF family [Longilinea arvoryzae]|uniref:Protein translocase subunit SecD n=1 Tax=Longilinea arvoryzae TaxID=360412 RepID=A0A0S7BLI4_9CHLR|nr:protein translocase subunit SecD [Longilinea arvoryzae]GAP14843.1 protein-export membrane protein, SecD/SecF family [Longilinea arvoryzae]
MSRRYVNILLIFVLLAVSIWADLTTSGIGKFQPKTVLGLDLRGGLQVILEAKPAAGVTVTRQDLEDAKQILENRANALGVSEVTFQVAGDNSIVGEFPGVTDPKEVIDTISKVALLEFVDFGDVNQSEIMGKTVITDEGGTASTTATPEATASAEATPTAEATQSAEATPTAEPSITEKIWHTVMIGSDLKEVGVQPVQNSAYYEISFTLSDEGTKIFSDFTTNNVGKILGIVLDKKVISAPSINTAITEGQGVITGKFTRDEANNLAVQMRYGSLPVPLEVVQTRLIGPTLGADSLNKSLIAYGIGFVVMMLFMAIYYRVPGLMADLSIMTYAVIAFAIFRSIPVTLTLSGIAGFMLSTGSALDANILSFERMKEELRAGRTVAQAIELGWKRAWPSIRDSNIAALITSAILFWFGSTFGASIVKGFALTLALGVVISVFTALFVTRNFLGAVMSWIKDAEKRPGLFGL